MNDTSAIPDIQAPPLHLLALEARVFAEIPWFLLRSLSVRGMPRGDGHPVMVVPGFGASDLATLPLRRALQQLGYAVYGWDQGTNFGMRPAIRNAMTLRLQKLSAEHQSPRFLEPETLLVLQGTHRCKSAELMMQGGNTHSCRRGEFFHVQGLCVVGA